MNCRDMNASATSAITAKMASWILARLCRCIYGPWSQRYGMVSGLPGLCWGRPRCTGWGTGRWCGPTATPAGQIALPPGAGEDGCVDAAEREVDDRRQVGVITPLPFFDGLVRKWEGGNPAERPRQARAGVGERLQDRSGFPQYLDHVLLGLVDGVGDQGAEFAELIGRVDKVVPLLVEHRQRIGDGLERPIHDGLLLG